MIEQTYSGGGMIINSKNYILLINEGDRFWGFPKGRVEENETALATAVREIEEETGITNIKLIKELGTYQRHPMIDGNEDVTELKNITLFLFQTQQAIPATNSEKNECAWFPLHQVVKKLSHLKDGEFFASLKEWNLP